MERKKNIISIGGEDTYASEEELTRLKKAFRERQDGQNIDTYIFEDIKDWKTIRENIQTIGLFAEKRLFVFRGGETKSEGVSSRKTDPKALLREEILLSVCKDLDEATFLIFFDVIFLPKGELGKWIEESADIRKFDTVMESARWQKRFPEVSDATITKVLALYQKSINQSEKKDKYISSKIAHTLEKIELLGDAPDIESSVENLGGGKIFDLIDTIMRGDRRGAVVLIRKMLESTSVYALHPSLLSLMRTNAYVLSLKSLGKSVQEIGNILGAHPYVIEKAYRSPLSASMVRDFYKKILAINIAYRSGRGLHDGELGRIFAIERALMGLKK